VRIARYWTREAGEATGPDGRPVRAVARGWSQESLEAAREVARRTARRLAERLASRSGEARQYAYGERPLPEPILREFADGERGAPRAVVTRNSYGALVLNAAALMFVDIDRAEPVGAAASLAGALSGVLSLFGRAGPPAPAAGERPDAVVAEVEQVARASGLGARVYKTAAGYRALVTSTRLEPGSGVSEELLRRFGADPLYVRLCRLQESFRARLTPKPWRCGLRPPPVSFPFAGPAEESRFRAWEAEYEAATAGYATCRYLASAGDGRVAPELADLVRYHDEATRADSRLPLA